MRIRSLARTILATCMAIVLSACALRYPVAPIESRPAGQTDFPGIAQLLTDAPDQVLDIVLVHGMCTHYEKWASDSIHNLFAMLGASKMTTITAVQVADTNVTVFKSRMTLHGRTLRVSAVLWSPVVASLKNQLCYDQTKKSIGCTLAGHDKPDYPYDRATLNRLFKDKLLNDCLADALIYQGKARDDITAQLQKAILVAVTHDAAAMRTQETLQAAALESSPLVLVTESLGSKMTFDAIRGLAVSPAVAEAAAGIRTLDRLAQIFMAANQMPLLALADQRLPERAPINMANAGGYQDSLAELIAIKREQGRFAPGIPNESRCGAGTASQGIRVIAFTDPNDLLSYILVPARQAAPYDVVDAALSNDVSYFGLFENPGTAHGGYLSNRAALRLIVDGNPQVGCQAALPRN